MKNTPLLVSIRFACTVACYELTCSLAEMEEELNRALELAQRAVDLSPEELKASPLAALGWVHFKRREYDPAVQCLLRSSELEPSAEMIFSVTGVSEQTGVRFATLMRLLTERNGGSFVGLNTVRPSNRPSVASVVFHK